MTNYKQVEINDNLNINIHDGEISVSMNCYYGGAHDDLTIEDLKKIRDFCDEVIKENET